MGYLKKGNPFWAKQIPRWKNANEALRHRGFLKTLRAPVSPTNLTRTRIQKISTNNFPANLNMITDHCPLSIRYCPLVFSGDGF